MGDYQFEAVCRRVPFRECALAGVSFHLDEDDELWDELMVGTRLALVRDRYNTHDRNAVAMALADDYDGDPESFDFDLILGYVPRYCNSDLAAMMDAGYAGKFSAEISSYSRYGNYSGRIGLTIFIESAEPEIVRPDLLRAESLSVPELRRMAAELSERGVAYFRFGGFPVRGALLPVVGEKIVMVHRGYGGEVLFLMRVLATGDDCARYVADPESIRCDDDCSPFILTNVMGPVRIKKAECPFLQGVDLCRFTASEYLSPRLTRGFSRIFKKQLMATLNRDNVDMDPSIDDRPQDMD